MHNHFPDFEKVDVYTLQMHYQNSLKFSVKVGDYRKADDVLITTNKTAT